MAWYSQFARDERGNISIIMAAFLIVMCAIGGVAIDYAVAIDRKRSMDVALDSAILAGVKAAADARQKGQGDWKAAGERTMASMFAVNLPPGKNYEKLTFNGTVTADGPKVSGTGSYTGHSFTTFMNIFGKEDVRFGSQATAAVQTANYVDIHFDTSASMGIGAELADMAKMYTATGCEFACHQLPDWQPELGKYTPAKAAAAGATLRMDVIRSSITNLIKEIRSRVKSDSTIRVALHTFSRKLATPQSLTSDLATVETKASALSMVTGADGASFLSYALERLALNLPIGGQGNSATSPLSFVVLLSDGIDDAQDNELITSGSKKGLYKSIWPTGLDWRTTSPSKSPTDDALMQAFSPTGCSMIKLKNHRILAVQIQYVRPPMAAVDVYFKHKVAFVTKELAKPLVDTFKSCVTNSATDYVMASNSSQIGPMLSRILNEVVLPKVVHLKH